MLRYIVVICTFYPHWYTW